MSTKAASEFLSVNLGTGYRLVDEGELPAYKFGRVILMKAVDILASISAARIEPGTLLHLYSTPIPRRVA